MAGAKEGLVWVKVHRGERTPEHMHLSALFGPLDSSDEEPDFDDDEIDMEQPAADPPGPVVFYRCGVEPLQELSDSTLDEPTNINVGVERPQHVVYGVPENKRGIAFQLWPSALVLCRFLEKQVVLKRVDLSKTTCVELGAGLGTVGFLAGHLGARKVYVTDLPEVCSHLEVNARANFNQELRKDGDTEETWFGPAKVLQRQDAVVVASLPWGAPGLEMCHVLQPTIDLILAADVVYWEHLFEPLIVTLRALSRPSTTIWMTHLRRRKADKRFFTMAGRYFDITVVDKQRLPEFRSYIHVYSMTLKT